MERRTVEVALSSLLGSAGAASVVAGIVNQIPWLIWLGAPVAFGGVSGLIVLRAIASSPAPRQRRPLAFDPIDVGSSRKLGEQAPIVDLLIDAKTASNRAAIASKMGDAALQLEIGEAGELFNTKAAPYQVKRTLNLRVANTGSASTIRHCRVLLTNISPAIDYDGPWVLAEEFGLSAGDHVVFPLVTYGEAPEPNKSPTGDSFIQVHAQTNAPTLEVDRSSTLTLRATGADVPFVEIRCVVSVDDSGRLRIRDAGHKQDPDGEFISLTDGGRWLYEHGIDALKAHMRNVSPYKSIAEKGAAMLWEAAFKGACRLYARREVGLPLEAIDPQELVRSGFEETFGSVIPLPIDASVRRVDLPMILEWSQT